jgi:hypothetical protein
MLKGSRLGRYSVAEDRGFYDSEECSCSLRTEAIVHNIITGVLAHFSYFIRKD